MEPDRLLCEGDFGFPFQHVCVDADGPVDLSDADTVTLELAPIQGGPGVEFSAQNEDDSNGSVGLVSYTWVEGDTDLPGLYQARFRVVWNGTNTDPEAVRSFPAGDPLLVRIEARVPAPLEV